MVEMLLHSNRVVEIKLIVISQAISVAFLHWLEAFAEEHGPVELWTGVDFAASSEKIRVRRLVPYNKTSYRTRLLSDHFQLPVMQIIHHSATSFDAPHPSPHPRLPA